MGSVIVCLHKVVCDWSLYSATFQAFVLPMPLCGVSPKLPYCVVITSIFLKIWNGRESHQDIKACSKRQTASIVLFQRGTIMYCNHLARIHSSIITKTSDSDDCTVRSIVVVMKIRVSVSSLSKVQLRHPWQESIFV